MSCTTCGNTCGQNCGCEKGLVTPPSGTPQTCPDPNPCSETFDAQCIIYTGDDILCNQDEVVATNTNIADALNDIVDFFCENTVPVTYTGPTLTCSINGQTETVVPTGATLNNALTSIVQLACLGAGNANCTCLYEAKLTLTSADLTTARTMMPFAGKAGKAFNILVPSGKAIEFVSGSYYVNFDGTYTYPLNAPTLRIITPSAKVPQATDDDLQILETGTESGIYLFLKLESNASLFIGEDLYFITEVANISETVNTTVTANILYRFVDYN